MAKEYIEREAALNAIHEEWDEVCNYDGSGYWIASETENAIDRVPAADVAPVRHGRWAYEEPNGANSFKGAYWCDNCHQPVTFKENFCPNCGADMRPSEEPESLTYIPPEERSVVDDD